MYGACQAPLNHLLLQINIIINRSSGRHRRFPSKEPAHVAYSLIEFSRQCRRLDCSLVAGGKCTDAKGGKSESEWKCRKMETYYVQKTWAKAPSLEKGRCRSEISQGHMVVEGRVVVVNVMWMMWRSSESWGRVNDRTSQQLEPSSKFVILSSRWVEDLFSKDRTFRGVRSCWTGPRWSRYRRQRSHHRLHWCNHRRCWSE